MKKLILAAVLVVFGVAITAPDVSAHGGQTDISQENGLLYVSTPLFFPDGEPYIDTPADDLGSAIFRFGQAITRIHDITFLSRVRVESTFYEDLESAIKDAHGEEGFVRNYADMAALPRADIARLTNAANDQIATFRVLDTLEQKIAAGTG